MTTWTMTRRQLRQWLGPVLPHAGTGKKDLPILRTVHIRSLGARTVVALATDQYTMALHRHDLGDDMAAVDFSVPATSLGKALRVLSGDPDAPVTVGTDQSGSSLSSLGTTVHMASAEQPSNDIATQMLKLAAKVLAGLADARPITGGVSVNPQMLARWRHLPGPITIRSAPTRVVYPRTRVIAPLLICHGERFVGLQMPRRGADDWTPDGWLALLSPPGGEEDAA